MKKNILKPCFISSCLFFLLLANCFTVFASSSSNSLGWLKLKDNEWYYFNDDGKRVDGWINSGGEWYYGTILGLEKGWHKINGIWYYFDKNSGALLTNTTTPDGFKVDKEGKYIKR